MSIRVQITYHRTPSLNSKVSVSPVVLPLKYTGPGGPYPDLACIHPASNKQSRWSLPMQPLVNGYKPDADSRASLATSSHCYSISANSSVAPPTSPLSPLTSISHLPNPVTFTHHPCPY
eukprot:750446-Hanusia_phi.AAC.10